MMLLDFAVVILKPDYYHLVLVGQVFFPLWFLELWLNCQVKVRTYDRGFPHFNPIIQGNMMIPTTLECEIDICYMLEAFFCFLKI